MLCHNVLIYVIKDIEEDSRETTMKYSPGARDGVFVVEVQQGMLPKDKRS